MRYTCLLLIAFSILCGQIVAAEKPNIIVILVDDMGFSDIGCYGSEARPDSIAAWDSLDADQPDRFDHLMAVYAATVARMDKAIGDLTNVPKVRGELGNTLILFMSDNGGNAECGPAGRSNGDPTKVLSNWFCGESWAFLQNTPSRLYKHYNHEGGIATPLIAHWPSGIAAKNELRKQPAHSSMTQYSIFRKPPSRQLRPDLDNGRRKWNGWLPTLPKRCRWASSTSGMTERCFIS